MKKKVFKNIARFFPAIYNVLNKTSSIRIIYYHRINKKLDPYYFNTGITPSDFRKQLEFLTSKYQPVSLTEAYDMVSNGMEFNNHFCVTFDDGFSECYNEIAPILDEFGIKATFFLTESCIDNIDMIWRNKLLVLQSELEEKERDNLIQKIQEEFQIEFSHNFLKSSNNWKMSQKEVMTNFLWKESKLIPLEDYLCLHKPYLTEKQIFSLIEKGHEIGSHTYSHPFCHKLNKSEINYEIIGSAERLNQRFSFDSTFFSYPFGSTVHPEMENYIIKNSGLKMLLGINDNFSNNKLNSHWERVIMEQTFDDSMYSFYVTPYARKLFTTKNKRH